MADLAVYGSLERSRTWWVVWMCQELGIQYHSPRTEVHFDPVWKEQDYLSINPNGFVPSIKDGDFVLWESMAINLYLAKKYGLGRLCPDSLEGEALASQWSFWAVTRLEVPLLVLSTANRNYPPGDEMERYYLKHIPMWTTEEVARSRAVLNGPLQMLNEKLASSPYLLGSTFSVADLNVSAILSRNAGAKINLSGNSNLVNWLHSCWSRPGCLRKDALLRDLELMH